MGVAPEMAKLSGRFALVDFYLVPLRMAKCLRVGLPHLISGRGIKQNFLLSFKYLDGFI